MLPDTPFYIEKKLFQVFGITLNITTRDHVECSRSKPPQELRNNTFKHPLRKSISRDIIAYMFAKKT